MATHEVWIYDLRTNIENINKGNPLDRDLFEDFELNYNLRPRQETERFKKFRKDDIENRDFNLDIFWLRDSSSTDSSLLNPIELASEAAKHLAIALNSADQLLMELGNHNKIR